MTAGAPWPRLGQKWDIHGTRRSPVGERLACAPAVGLYGVDVLAMSQARNFRSMVISSLSPSHGYRLYRRLCAAGSRTLTYSLATSRWLDAQ
jgi:hypothetical protein